MVAGRSGFDRCDRVGSECVCQHASSQHKLSADESRRVVAFRGEIDKYLRDARKAIAEPAGTVAICWRPVLLNLLRAHSLVWETLSEALRDEVKGGTVDNRLSPTAASCKEVLLGITVLLPKLQQVRTTCALPAQARGPCENCDE